MANDGQFDAESGKQAQELAIARARADAEEKRANALMTAAKAKAMLAALDVQHIDLGDVLKGAQALVAMKVLNGEVPIRNGSEAASLITALGQSGRLEKGEATSNQHTHITDSTERRRRIIELRDEADRNLAADERAERDAAAHEGRLAELPPSTKQPDGHDSYGDQLIGAAPTS